ncbi:hypothetical protein [Parerythrobacter lacustris]|uniref:Restriction endonuclease n=1 Tax=Parerythrobacter lacustris TaxID=2969984 RepID=A0ABT1XP65_9SPHN|nr:hypothetical protein [Parerythrobacter lacustris]MCR2833458.1 hypothetical protein [Parerythrobacter lacustris]
MPLPLVEAKHFNANAQLPYGLQVDHIREGMNSFLDFLGFINDSLATRELQSFESMLMPANFSSIVGEYMSSAIPRHCPSISKNQYHNGHPDLVPTGMYPGNSSQYGHEGIEIKGSRYLKGWQGHNAEESFLLVFCYEANRPADEQKGVAPFPFRYLLVCGAKLEASDWQFAGRSETSRRTITATIKRSGYDKMMTNWIYKAPLGGLLG